MNAKAELEVLLGRLDRHEDVDRSRQRARTLVDQLDDDELADLADALARNGMSVLRASALCPRHLGVAPERRRAFRNSLPDDHVLSVMMDEHVHILAALDRLENLVGQERRPTRDGLHEIVELLEFLIGIEPHHQREEQVLFPAMREKDIVGPTAIMDREHAQMRRQKHTLKDMTHALLDGREISWFLVRDTGTELSGSMREHIFREDNILYPMAAGTIRSASAWADLKRRCDAVGYCCGHDHHSA